MVEALRRVLSERDDIEIVGEATTGDAVLPLVVESRPDVVLLDIGLPGTDGIECARQIRGRLRAVRILMLTAYGDPESLKDAERAGADGFILKSIGAPDLVALLEAPAAEGFLVAGFPEPDPASANLTQRERVVLRAIGDGLTNQDIGRELWISEETVKFHLKNLYRKLGAANRAELVTRARRGTVVWAGGRPTRIVG